MEDIILDFVYCHNNHDGAHIQGMLTSLSVLLFHAKIETLVSIVSKNAKCGGFPPTCKHIDPMH